MTALLLFLIAVKTKFFIRPDDAIQAPRPTITTIAQPKRRWRPF